MKTLLSLLVVSLLTLSAHAQGATFLTYRAGAVVTQDEMGPVNLNEFQLRLPGLKWASKDGLSFQSAFGYHHASMGSDHRFWGSAPIDAFLFEGSVDVPVGANSVLTAGTSVRWMRSFALSDSGKEAFHRSALVWKRHRDNENYFRVGIAYRSGVALEVIPVLGYEGRLTPEYDISALLPGRAYVYRRLSNGDRVGVFGRYQTTPYLIEPGTVGDADVMRHRMIRFGVSNETRISSMFVLRVDIATTLVNDQQWVGPSTDIRADLDQSVVIDAALILRRD